jgi:hypothetical protein
LCSEFAGMAPRGLALPEGPALELSLTPRLESWERHDHPAQMALREFVVHVQELVDPVIASTRGELAVRLRCVFARCGGSVVGARS